MNLPVKLSTRISRIVLITLIAFSALGFYLFHLQIAQSSFFTQLSKKNFLRKEKILSPRGNITDRSGVLLATNRPVYSIYWQGTGNKALTTHQEILIHEIMKLCFKDPFDLEVLKKAERGSKKLLLAKDLSQDVLLKIVERSGHEKNIIIKRSFDRSYPYGELASHVVGYLGIKDAIQGKMGLEKLYDTRLQGHAGKIVTVINSVGHPLQQHTVSQALEGKTLQTTLNLSLQQIAEEVFPSQFDGCLIVMDTEGGLEVVLSRPSFEPGMFLKPIPSNQWNKLLEQKGFLNRAFTACYPPASLFKIVTLTAALETGLIRSTDSWHCLGHTEFKGRRFHCNNLAGHGHISTKQAFAYSCNIPFYEIGKKISVNKLAYYAQKLGLGCKTGIMFPEKEGLVPTSEWKLRVKKEPWWPGETLSLAIGQSSLLVTPLQMACMISSICTGYKVRPRLLIDEPIEQAPLALKPDTLLFLQQCLQSVVHQGTGVLLGRLDHFSIRGKSGTAQVRSLTTGPLQKGHVHHGYFAAQFRYKQQKPYTIVVFLEHAGSSKYAIYTAYQFLARYAQIAH